jgi:hypothetical protein
MNIYKVNHLTNENTIHSIYVFYGKHKEKLDILFKTNPSNETFSSIFTQEELKQIQDTQIPVYFFQQNIHPDDSIGTIKWKLFQELKETFSLSEIYLFGMKEEIVEAVSVYQDLTQNKKLELTKMRLYNFLSNIVSDEKGNPIKIEVPDKTIYNYDDILSFNLNGKKYWTNKAIGQKIFLYVSEYPFVVNPFSTVGYDPVITKKSLTTLNSHLLLNFGKLVGNNIYMCLAKDVISQSDRNVEKTIELYFPFLHEEKIQSVQDLEERREKLIEKNKKKQKDSLAFQDVDLFYDVYKERTNELNYKSRGIKSIKLVIHPIYKLKLPLLTVFKLLHATKNTPFIKYNPSNKQDKLLRLYTEINAQDGRKIPFLQKEIIFRLLKTVGKNKTVCVYIKEWNGVCEFEENGNIVISSEFTVSKSIEEISNMIIEYVNPIIEEIQSYLEQNGYVISLFKTIENPFIEIKQLNYETTISINKKINLNAIKGCMSSIFITETTDSAKGYFVLRLKRVANFNKLNSIEAFVIEKQESGLRGEDIIVELLENYKDLSEKDAVDLLKQMASELQVERGVKKSDIEIKVNPGFKTVLQVNNMTEDVTITVENINDIYYLETIPIYLDTLIRLLQDKKATRVTSSHIKSLCSGNEKEDIVLEDILMPTEESFLKEQEEEIYEEDITKAKNALDMFFGEDDEDQEEDDDNEIIIGENDDSDNDEDDSDDDDDSDNDDDDSDASDNEVSDNDDDKVISLKGGNGDSAHNEDEEDDAAINHQETIKNIDGLRLNNPYYFQNRIKTKEPRLILTEDQGKFNAYSRVCQPNTRTPVLVTQQELNKIKKEKPGVVSEENGDVITYGSDPSKKYHYICPQYWDLKNETVITEEEIQRNNLQDKILTKNEKTVKNGKYIYQFYQSKSGEKWYPGFQADSHPDGYCLPCCFKKWKTKTHIDLRKKCSSQENPDQPTDAQPATENKPEKQEYIKGPEKFPLSQGRWGYLPIGVQQLLKGDDNSTVRENKPILLRHGVETSRNQSFVACISDAIYYAKNGENGDSKEITIKQMKEVILSSLTIDNFPTFQNGNLITDFSLPTRQVDINSPAYKGTKLYNRLKSNPGAFEKICSSFENFIDFINNDRETIDYTYLWDVICRPNDKLFKDGVNLVILDIPNKDITADVQIICPTNHYTAYPYSSLKPTLFLIRQDNYFEPVYTYRQEMGPGTGSVSVPKLYIGKLFKEGDAKVPKSVISLFNNIVKPFYLQKCIPFSSLPTKYKMKQPILLNTLIDTIRDIGGYIFVRQVINYQGKVIGVTLKKNSSDGSALGRVVVPCYPSAIVTGQEYRYMDEPDNWNTYRNTITFLKDLYNASDKKIPCKPAFKMVDSEVIVGILTESNQFVQVNPPVPVSEANDDIPEMRGENYIVADDAIGFSISKKKGAKVNDTERIEYIQKIKLETGFFDVFRNTVRMLLNDYKNMALREKIEQVVNAPYIMYQGKLEQTKLLLVELIKSNVIFVDNYDFKMVKEVTTCLNKNDSVCAREGPLCTVNSGASTCQMVLPRKNLVTGAKNDINYYLKMADELIRYSRIKSFLFEPQSYLSFRSLDYNLRENEVILMQSLLTQEYFKGMVPVVTNQYVKYKGRDNV